MKLFTNFLIFCWLCGVALKELPASSLKVISKMGIIDVIPTDMTLEKTIFDGNINLRSPRYIYNLLSKLGCKRCTLCDCEIPELIQGAHIWPVANIKQENTMTFDDKLICATDGDNGLWLCENHHKMFDENMICFDQNGRLLLHNGLKKRHMKYINRITLYKNLPDFILTDKFLEYLWRRNKNIG